MVPHIFSEVCKPVSFLSVCFLFVKHDASFSTEVFMPLAFFRVCFLCVKWDASFFIGGL
jgi:hypothetical protein